ncbi:unnamed protein product, partial [marine sediment metagenome]
QRVMNTGKKIVELLQKHSIVEWVKEEIIEFEKKSDGNYITRIKKKTEYGISGKLYNIIKNYFGKK